MNSNNTDNSVKTFTIDLLTLQPSQLYINVDKLRKVESEYKLKKLFDPLPVKLLNERIILTDGHTRALTYYLNSIYSIEVYWDDPWGSEFLDKEEYEIAVQWCLDESIFSIKDLENRIITNDEYQFLWLERCQKMHETLK